MFGNGRRTIGVFVTKTYQELQKTLARGICLRARELGYNIAFFTNFLGYGELKYEAGEKSIADLPMYENFDGIILLPDAMYDEDYAVRIMKNIKKYSKCPVVNVGQYIDEYYNISKEDDAVMDEIIRHFIVDHGYRKIKFLSGPKSNPAAAGRLEAYRRIMGDYGIPLEEDSIYYGDFWTAAAKEAVVYWLSDREKWPEAIICANDYMAVTVCRELADRKISVPKDIAVSGFDNIELTKDYSPAITTAGLPIMEMGIEAVDKIHKHMNGIPQEKNTYVKSELKIRESCGCRMSGSNEVMLSRRNKLLEEIEAKEKDIADNAFMSAELTGVRTMDDLDHKVADYTRMNVGFSSFYMCLNKNWDMYDINSLPERTDFNEMIREVGIKNGEVLPKEEFTRPSLLGNIIMGEEPQVFYFNLLHYQEVCFGYTAISFHGNEVYRKSYQGWLINISNALENIRIHNELNRLVFKLEDMSIKDALTDLYNRRAIELLGQKYLKQCIEEQSRLMVFTADLNKLKYINDNYGHACGDIAIKAVADALKYAAEDDEICMRVGGDEFTVIGLEYDQNKMDHFIKKFEGQIRRFNAEGDYDFQVFVSYGWNIIKPDQDTSLEECLIVADTRMYQNKYEKKAFELKKKEQEK